MVVAGLLAGAALGVWRARQRGGNRLDMAQWAAVYAILFGLAGLILTILLGRLG
jgi:hypothetical protein